MQPRTRVRSQRGDHGEVRRQPLAPPTPGARLVNDADALERIGFHLMGMRAGLEQYRTGRRSALPDALKRWSRLLDRYDAALVQAAILLNVAVPSPPLTTS